MEKFEGILYRVVLAILAIVILYALGVFEQIEGEYEMKQYYYENRN